MLFIEEIHMNNMVAIICSKMHNFKKFFNKSLKKMFTESCVMFFSPSRAVLSAILRDEYLTSAVRTKEGDKAGSNQPPSLVLTAEVKYVNISKAIWRMLRTPSCLSYRVEESWYRELSQVCHSVRVYVLMLMLLPVNRLSVLFGALGSFWGKNSEGKGKGGLSLSPVPRSTKGLFTGYLCLCASENQALEVFCPARKSSCPG